MTKILKASVISAVMFGAPLATAAAASATHTDPCPGQHIQVYNESSNTEVAHFVCGTAGKDGKDGADGAKGATGPAGPKGEKGDAGATGPAGSVGATGSAGVAGPAGSKGETGATGNAGAPGMPGAPGLIGLPGATGAPGVDGKDGAKGDKGDVGAPGAPGDKGDKGDTGAPGMTPVIESADAKGDCPAGGVVITSKSSKDAEGALWTTIICNGVNGTNGSNGKNGAAGKNGTTTIITKDANGNTVSTIGNLPSTGADSNTEWMLGGIAAIALATGAGVLLWAGKRKDV